MIRRSSLTRALWLAPCLGLVLGSAAMADAPEVHALTGVRIVTAPGQVVESGTVVLRDGLIEAAGADVEAPPGARVWDREGMTVYPGLIEAYSPRKWPDEDDDEAAQGVHENSLVRPERDATAVAIDESTTTKLRAAGFTTALVAPQGAQFEGSSIVVNLGDGEVADNQLRRAVAQHVNLEMLSNSYPNSAMGAVALFRQTIHDARWQRDASAAWERNPAQPRPTMSPALSALAPIIAGSRPVVFKTSNPQDTLRVTRLADELGLEAWILGHGSEYQWLERTGAIRAPVILPLNVPDEPNVPDEDKDDMGISLSELRHWDQAPTNPKRLLDAGTVVAFTSNGLGDPKALHAHLETAIDRGLTAEQALAALTTTPAKMLGIDRLVGTVSAGKIGNLVVVEGDLFVENPKITELWVDGKRYTLKELEPPEIEPAGTWELTLLIPDGSQIPVTLELVGEAPSLDGSIAAMGQAAPVTSAQVSGSSIEVIIDSTRFGMPGTITLNLEIDGDSASGSGTAPPGGFTIRGSRTSKPDPETARETALEEMNR